MRHKDPELMNRIKQYISEYYLENVGGMPTITQIARFFCDYVKEIYAIVK